MMLLKAYKTTCLRILPIAITVSVTVDLIFYFRAPEILLIWWLVPLQICIMLVLAAMLTPIEYFKFSNYKTPK